MSRSSFAEVGKRGGLANKGKEANQSRRTAHSQGWRPSPCSCCGEERPSRERLTNGGEWLRLCQSCAQTMKTELATG